MINNFLIKHFADSLFYLVSFFTAITAIVPLLVKQGQVFNRKYKWYKRIRWAGYLVIITSSLGIYFNSLQNTYNDLKTEKNEIALRDSLKKNFNVTVDTMQKRFINGNKEIIKAVINSLGSYGYKLDSANSNLIKIVKDSSKTKIILPDAPVLGLCNEYGIKLLEKKGQTYNYKVSFCSVDASSTDFKLDSHVVLIDSVSGKYYYSSQFDFLPSDAKLAKGEAYNRYFSTTTSIEFTDICIFVNGSYANFDKTKRYYINNVYYYEIRNNKFGQIVGNDKELITKFIQDNKSNWHYAPYKKSYN